MTDAHALRLEEVSKRYQRGPETVHAVEDVTLAVPAGEFTAVVGHSGSGKTTLLNLMGCLDRPSAGRVLVHGREVHAAGEAELAAVRQEDIGFVFQQFFLIPTLTVLENVQLPALFSRRADRQERARELLGRVGMGHRLHHRPGQLSGGEMQRAAIARSLINDPRILLADEPTGNLDNRNAAAVMELFEDLHRQGLTVVLVTHNPDLAKRCTRTVHIEDGRLVA
jgi:putative ABC transport system ATP-binding protein